MSKTSIAKIQSLYVDRGQSRSKIISAMQIRLAMIIPAVAKTIMLSIVCLFSIALGLMAQTPLPGPSQGGNSTGGSGTVTSVSGPSWLTWANPTTTPTATVASQTANFFLAAPNGTAGAATFRAIAAADIPSLAYGNCTVTGAAGTLQKTNGSTACAASSIIDNGTTVATTEQIQAPSYQGTGSNAYVNLPSNTSHTAAAGDFWNNAGALLFGASSLPVVIGPASSTNGHCPQFSGTSGGVLADSGSACGGATPLSVGWWNPLIDTNATGTATITSAGVLVCQDILPGFATSAWPNKVAGFLIAGSGNDALALYTFAGSLITSTASAHAAGEVRFALAFASPPSLSANTPYSLCFSSDTSDSLINASIGGNAGYIAALDTTPHFFTCANVSTVVSTNIVFPSTCGARTTFLGNNDSALFYWQMF